MEKINIEKYEGKSVDYIATKTAFKVNEIIDELNDYKVDNSKLKISFDWQFRNRLKTLEDKVKFIMENSIRTKCNKNNNTLEFSDESLQDLWDEGNDYMLDKAHNTTIPNKHTVKEWKCNKCGTVFDISSVDGEITSAKCSCKPTDKECKFCTTDVCVCGKRTAELDKSEKIEEIISELKKTFFLNLSGVMRMKTTIIEGDQYYRNATPDDIESWLRDKLKEL